MRDYRFPFSHKKDVWNVPDCLFHQCQGMLISGMEAARLIGCGRHFLYSHADEWDLTVVRRHSKKNGRYFLRSEIQERIREIERQKKYTFKDVVKIARRH